MEVRNDTKNLYIVVVEINLKFDLQNRSNDIVWYPVIIESLISTNTKVTACNFQSSVFCKSTCKAFESAVFEMFWLKFLDK